MRRLLLVKHSVPDRASAAVPADWALSAEGIAKAEELAVTLEPFLPLDLYSSPEQKALQTAQVIAARHVLAVRVQEGLREQGPRSYLESEAEFRRAVGRLLRHPEQPTTLGTETGRLALERFERAVREAAGEAGATPCMVSHGTVMTQLVARHNDIDPVEFWAALSMPQLVVVSATNFALET